MEIKDNVKHWTTLALVQAKLINYTTYNHTIYLFRIYNTWNTVLNTVTFTTICFINNIIKLKYGRKIISHIAHGKQTKK